jgi:polysaccharide chain length determinant protein (PEP-CTERM system associated)
MLGHRALTTQDYISILKKRWWMIALPTVILTAVGYGITFFVPPQYLSQTLVLIEQQKVPDDYVKPVITEDLDTRLASMKEQILSRSRLQPIVDHYNLYGTKKMSMDDRIDLVRKDIDIKPIRSQITGAGGLPGFFIMFKAADPHTAQQVCGEIESLFVNEDLRSRTQSAEGTTEFLKGQLADAKRNLDEQDAKLADFQRQYMGKLPTEEAPNMNMLASLNMQLDAATQALARLQQDKTYGESMMSAAVAREQPSGPDLQRTEPQTQQLELQNLLKEEADLTAKYTDSYPDVVAVRRKIAELRADMAKPAPATPAPVAAAPTTPRNEPMSIVQLRAQMHGLDQMITQKTRDQAQIQSQIRIYQDRVSSSPMVLEQYKNLTRDYQTAQQIYENLLRNVNSSKMATDLELRQQGRQFKVMDAPNLPEGPVYPRVELFVGGGLAAGLLLGLLVVGWIEYRDTAVRSERDLWAFTRLPTLAVISLTGNAQPEAKRRWFKFGKGKEKSDAGGTSKPLADASA